MSKKQNNRNNTSKTSATAKKNNDQKRFLISLIAFILIIALAFGLYTVLNTGGDSFVDNGDKEVKELIPDALMYDASGKRVQIHDLIGKPLVINLWASWCPPCKKEMPDIDKLYKELGDEVNFAIVNMTTANNETEKSAKAFIEEGGYSFPVYYDIDGTVASQYPVNAFPTTYFVDKDGYLVAYAYSMLDEASIMRGINLAKGIVEPIE